MRSRSALLEAQAVPDARTVRVPVFPLMSRLPAPARTTRRTTPSTGVSAVRSAVNRQSCAARSGDVNRCAASTNATLRSDVLVQAQMRLRCFTNAYACGGASMLVTTSTSATAQNHHAGKPLTQHVSYAYMHVTRCFAARRMCASTSSGTSTGPHAASIQSIHARMLRTA